MIVGAIVTLTLVVRRNACTANSYPVSSHCQSYNPGIHWAYALIAIGAAMFVAGALSATNLLRGNGRTGRAEASKGDPD